MSGSYEESYEGRCQLCEKSMEVYQDLHYPKSTVLPRKKDYPEKVHLDCYVEYLEEKVITIAMSK